MTHPGNPGPFPSDMSTRFSATFGLDHWVNRTNGWTLIGLNAALFGTQKGKGAQVAWLRDTLDTSAGPIGLFLQEAWFGTLDEDAASDGRYATLETRRTLATLFDGHDLRFIAGGHPYDLRDHHAYGAGADWVPIIASVTADATRPGVGTRLTRLTRLTLNPQGHHFDHFEMPMAGNDAGNRAAAPAPSDIAYA